MEIEVNAWRDLSNRPVIEVEFNRNWSECDVAHDDAITGTAKVYVEVDKEGHISYVRIEFLELNEHDAKLVDKIRRERHFTCTLKEIIAAAVTEAISRLKGMQVEVR